MKLCYFYYFNSFTSWWKAVIIAYWKSRADKCKNIDVFTFSQVESTITMAIFLITANIIPQTFE